MNSKMYMGVAIGLIVGALAGYFGGKLPGKNDITDEIPTLSDASGSCSAGGTATAPLGLVEVDGKAYGRDALSVKKQTSLYDIANDAYRKTSTVVKEFAVQLALAKDKKRPLSVEKLPPLEELLDKAKVTDGDVKKFFEQNKHRVPPGTKLDKIKEQLKGFLLQKKVATAFEDTYRKLEDTKRIKLLLTAPEAPSINVDFNDYPTVGKKGAGHTLVEISDYTCGHCQSVHAEVKNVIDKMSDKLKFIQVNYSLNPTGKSGEYVRGAFCAQKQGIDQFWKYHHKTFAELAHDHSAHGHNHDHSDLPSADKLAKMVGLDLAAFKKCVKSKAAKGFIEKTNKMLKSIGVTGTPTFFLNNKKLVVGREGLWKALKAQMAL